MPAGSRNIRPPSEKPHMKHKTANIKSAIETICNMRQQTIFSNFISQLKNRSVVSKSIAANSMVALKGKPPCRAQE